MQLLWPFFCKYCFYMLQNELYFCRKKKNKDSEQRKQPQITLLIIAMLKLGPTTITLYFSNLTQPISRQTILNFNSRVPLIMAILIFLETMPSRKDFQTIYITTCHLQSLIIKTLVSKSIKNEWSLVEHYLWSNK